MRTLTLAMAVLAAGAIDAHAAECKVPAFLTAPSEKPDVRHSSLPENLIAFYEPPARPANPVPAPVAARRDASGIEGAVRSEREMMEGHGFKRHVVVRADGKRHELFLARQTPAAEEARLLAEARARRDPAPESNPFILAVRRGDAKAVDKLIAQGANVRIVRDRFDRPAPLVAMAIEAWITRQRTPASPQQRARDAATFRTIVESLVRAGGDLLASHEAETPLAKIAFAPREFSASTEMRAMAAFLLEHGAGLDTNKGMNVLEHVAKTNDPELLDVLLRLGKPSQAHKDTALALAVEERQFPSALVALNAGASTRLDTAVTRKCCARSWVEALDAPYGRGRREFLKALIERKVATDFILRRGMPLLHEVMHDHEIMEGMLKLGASPNARGKDGMTALHLAMSGPVNPAGKARSVALLLKYGAVPQLSPGPNGMTPLMMSKNEDGAAIALLLNAGDRIDTTNSVFRPSNDGEPPKGPIYWAASTGNDTLGVALVVRTAGSAQDPGAIYHAASRGLPATLNALLDNSRRHINVRDRGGATPLIAAAASGRVDTVAVLLDRSAADINGAAHRPLTLKLAGLPEALMMGPVPDQRTALMEASLAGHADVVALLLHRGADTERRDSYGQRAIDLVRRGRPGEAPLIFALLECAKQIPE